MIDDKASQAGESVEGDGMQGEGNKEAARRFNKASIEFEKSHDVDQLARNAAPKSPADAQSMREAEEEGRRHSRGEDEKDITEADED
jgi:hypothetical protein